MRRNWVETDLDGLAKILERRGGKFFAAYELAQNSLDQNITEMSFKLTPIVGRPAVAVEVIDDDPDGFADITHAFTMFAESNKKANPEQAGRFNLGEKLVLAICEEAVISTTTGTVEFRKDGTRHQDNRRKTESGSSFYGIMKMTRAELQEAIEALRRLIIPKGVKFSVNGEIIPSREPIAEFEVVLPTEIADAEGNLKRTSRKAKVQVYEPFEGEEVALYELGIPVVGTGDRFHVNVRQKIPLNMDRDNVTPAYLRVVRTAVFNHTYKRLENNLAATSDWVQSATSDPDCDGDGFSHAMDLRFGKKRVSNDLSDPEGTKIAHSRGFQIVFGGSMTGGQWNNARRTEAILPAGKVTPSPKPYSPDGDPLNTIPPENWSEKMHHVVNFCGIIGSRLIGRRIYIEMASDSKLKALATYGPSGILVLNKLRLGNAFFESFPHNMGAVLKLLIHEMGHERCGDHLSADYHDALTALGADAVMLALTNPDVFAEAEWSAEQEVLSPSS